MDNATIRAAFARNVQVLTARPAVGHKTDVTRVRVRDGLTCEIEDGPWKLTADLAPKCGGNGAGPTPGTLGRAALGSCLAIGYVMWAAVLGVPLHHVEVEVQADSDVRGMYGVGEAPAGYSQVCYTVSVDSPAPPEDIMRVLDTAEAHSPYFDVFRRPQHLQRQVRMHQVEE
jgi:uncharacterized OsmC-like protein